MPSDDYSCILSKYKNILTTRQINVMQFAGWEGGWAA